jgi:hypothetical protein
VLLTVISAVLGVCILGFSAWAGVL